MTPTARRLVTHGGRIETWEHFQTLALDIRESLAAEERSRPADPDPDRGLADLGRPAAHGCSSSSPKRSGTATSR